MTNITNVSSADLHDKGYFALAIDLPSSISTTLVAGDYAIVGATDTVWTYDADTLGWKDSGGAGVYQPILLEGAFVNGDKTKLDQQSGVNTGDETETSINSKIIKAGGMLDEFSNTIDFATHKKYYDLMIMGPVFPINITTVITDNFEFAISTEQATETVPVYVNSVLNTYFSPKKLYYCWIKDGNLLYYSISKIGLSTYKNSYLNSKGTANLPHRDIIELPSISNLGGTSSDSGNLIYTGIMMAQNNTGIGVFTKMTVSGKSKYYNGNKQTISATSLSATATEELGTFQNFIAIYDGTDTKVYSTFNNDISIPGNWTLVRTFVGLKYRLIGGNNSGNLYFINIGTPSKNVYQIDNVSGVDGITLTFNSIPNAIAYNSCAGSVFSNENNNILYRFLLTDTIDNKLYIRNEIDGVVMPDTSGPYIEMGSEYPVLISNEFFLSQGTRYYLEYLF